VDDFSEEIIFFQLQYLWFGAARNVVICFAFLFAKPAKIGSFHFGVIG